MPDKRIINICLCLFMWAWLCPNKHIVYYTNKKPVDGTVYSVRDFFVGNRGLYMNGKFQQIWWENPMTYQECICPKCHKALLLKQEYFKEI